MVAIAANLRPLRTHYGPKPSERRRLWPSFPLDLAISPWYRSYQWREKGGRLWALRFRPRASVSTRTEGTSDHELRLVLELATDEELYELENILYGQSYFSPLLKSITSKPDVDYILEEADDKQREDYITHLESRFFFLAADARSTLRGWRPSYRNVLLSVRRKLKVSCSNKLSTEDLEVEIFLHLLQDYSCQENSSMSSVWDDTKLANGGNLGVGLSQWKLQLLAGLRTGANEFQDMILKGGGMLTLSRILQLLSGRFSGKMIMEAANYEIKREIIKRGGQMAAINLESRVALLAARKGLVGAASRYLGLRSLMIFLGPLLWGTFLADVVIQSLGTDYARVLRAIYAFAQDGKFDVDEEESEWVEFDAEFKPIEHPVEPLEDQPVKCPMPDSSLLNEGKHILQANEESIPLQADHKRHQKIHQDSSIQPPFWGSQYNIFQVFQQCKDFSS